MPAFLAGKYSLNSFTYKAQLIALVGFPAYHYTEYLVLGGAFPSTTIWVSALAALVVNAVAIFAPLRFGALSLERREF